MKKLILCTLALLVVAPMAYSGGPDVSGLTTGGPIFREGQKTWFNTSFSPEVSVWTDTAKERSLVIRAGYWFENRPGTEDLQSSVTYTVIKQGLPFWNLYVGVGSGLLVQIKDGEDAEAGALKIEVGAKVYKDFGFVLGTDYILGWGDVTPYFGLDLTPKL